MATLNGTIGTFVPDKLISGNEMPTQIKAVTLKAANGVVRRGTVLGIITTGELAVAVDNSKSDGSQTADCILIEDVDTGAAGATTNIVAEAYTSGNFNRSALIFGGDDTAANHESTLRPLGIYLSDNIAY